MYLARKSFKYSLHITSEIMPLTSLQVLNLLTALFTHYLNQKKRHSHSSLKNTWSQDVYDCLSPL